jgi:hypothetical protein
MKDGAAHIFFLEIPAAAIRSQGDKSQNQQGLAASRHEPAQKISGRICDWRHIAISGKRHVAYKRERAI